jgi:hypothetical protein
MDVKHGLLQLMEEYRQRIFEKDTGANIWVQEGIRIGNREGSTIKNVIVLPFT